MKFITKHQDITYVLRASEKVTVGVNTRNSKPIRAHFRGDGGGEFDTDDAARRFNWTDDEKRFAEEKLLTHFDFNAPSGGFWLEPGQDLPEWALQFAGAETSVDVSEMAGEGCQFVFITENESAEACPLTALSAEVPYCMKHALESGYEISVSKPEPAQAEPEKRTGRTQPRKKVEATA